MSYRMRAYLFVCEAGVALFGKTGITSNHVVDPEPGHRLPKAILEHAFSLTMAFNMPPQERGRRCPQRAETNFIPLAVQLNE